MKCPNCNQEIDNDSIFCEYCGAKIKQLPNSGSRPSSTMDASSGISKSKNLVLIITAALCLINIILFNEDGLTTSLSLLLSGALFYWLYASKISDALKLLLTILFITTGIIRAIVIHNDPKPFIIILIVEVVIMAIAYYNSTK